MGAVTQTSDLTSGDDPVVPGSVVGLTAELESQKTIRPQLNLWLGRSTAQYRNAPFASGAAGAATTFVETRFFAAYLLLQAVLWKQGPVEPIVGVGVGLFSFTPYDANGAELTTNGATRLEGETYGTTSALVPLSVGLATSLGSRLRAEVRYQRWLTLTDYLDNVGELGTRSGNDALSHFQLLLHLRLGEAR